MNAAVWGVALSADSGRTQAHLADGVAIVRGAWQPQSTVLPNNRALYALMELVEEGTCSGASAPAPFSIGSAWPSEGSPCSDPGALPGSCYSPDSVRRCGPTAVCEIVCLSTFDCPAGRRCGDEVGGQRTCVPL